MSPRHGSLTCRMIKLNTFRYSWRGSIKGIDVMGEWQIQFKNCQNGTNGTYSNNHVWHKDFHTIPKPYGRCPLIKDCWLMRKGQNYVFGIWWYKALCIKCYFRVKLFGTKENETKTNDINIPISFCTSLSNRRQAHDRWGEQYKHTWCSQIE